MVASAAPDDLRDSIHSAIGPRLAGLTTGLAMTYWIVPTTHNFERGLRVISSFVGEGASIGANLVQRGLAAAWCLTQPKPRVALGKGDLVPPTSRLEPVLSASAADLTERLRRLGLPTEDVPRPGSCLSDVVRSHDTIMGEDSTTVRDYDPDKVNLVRDNYRPTDVVPLLDPGTREWASNPDENILLSLQPR